MERFEWLSVLQYFWANGYDVVHGVSEGWLKEATLVSRSPDWVWAQASKLPHRKGWTFQEPDGTTVYHLMDARVDLPDYATKLLRALHGAELGLRAAFDRLGWQIKFPIPHPLIATIGGWHRHLRLPEHFSALFIDPVEEWLRRYGSSALRYNPYSESTGVFPIALLSGILWPGQFERAQTEIHRWSAFYDGAAWPAAWWIARVVTSLPWNELMNCLNSALTKLPKSSQVRSFCLDAWDSYQRGDSYDQWLKRLCSRAHYYPATHVVPNSAIIVAALCWGQQNWDSIIENICNAGFDPIHNSLIAGSVAKIAWPDMSTLSRTQVAAVERNLVYLGKLVLAKAHV